MKIKKSKTGRGFATLSFTDDYGCECSIQKSSSAFDSKIWFGIDKPKVQRFNNNGTGWSDITPVSTKENPVIIESRMHLTRKQVKKLIPILQNFVDTGEV